MTEVNTEDVEVSTHQCPACRKPMVWEPAADNGGAPAGWIFDCNCLDDELPPHVERAIASEGGQGG